MSLEKDSSKNIELNLESISFQNKNQKIARYDILNF